MSCHGVTGWDLWSGLEMMTHAAPSTLVPGHGEMFLYSALTAANQGSLCTPHTYLAHCEHFTLPTAAGSQAVDKLLPAALTHLALPARSV